MIYYREERHGKEAAGLKDGKKTRKNQEMFVVKSNDLVRARYNLTTQQQKLILYAISKIKANDRPGQWYEISIEDVCEACGLELDTGGFYYRTIKKDLQELTKRMWVIYPDREATVSWIGDAEIIPLSGKVHIRFHEKLQDHLFWLQSCYTQYKLKEVLVFHNKYAIRLYEILRSYITVDELERRGEAEKLFSVKELREMLQIDGYKIWGEFERNVIRKAVEEINKYSDIMRITYDTYKKGREVSTVNFIIRYPKAGEMYVSRQESRDRLSRRPQSFKTEETIEKIKQWRQKYPKGRAVDCIKDTGLTKYAVYRYWDTEQEEKQKEAAEKLEELKDRYKTMPDKLEKARKAAQNFKEKQDKLESLFKEAEEMEKTLAERWIAAQETEEKDAAWQEMADFRENIRKIATEFKPIGEEMAEEFEKVNEKLNRAADKMSREQKKP